MNLSQRTQKDYGSNIDSSFEQFKGISHVYHGSPLKLNVICGDKTGYWTKDKGSVFVTPYPAIACCFIIDKDSIVDRLEDQGINTIGIHFNYDIWELPVSQLNQIPNEVNVHIDEPGIEKFNGIANGYIYTIDFNRYAGVAREARLNRDSDIELVIPGNVVYNFCTPVKIRYSVSSLRYDPPYGVEKLKELGLDYLLEDHVHFWRAKTGIELIHNEPDISELNRIWSNWKVMPKEMKKISDKKSLELFGKTNEEHFLDLSVEYEFPDIVSSSLRKLQDFIYGCRFDDGSFITDKYDIDQRGGDHVVIQTPEEFEDTKGGMCHDASIYLDEVLTEAGVDHYCFYMSSDEPPLYPTHSWLVARDNSGKWRVLDVFSSKDCIWGGKYSSPEEASLSRAKDWLNEYSPNTERPVIYFSRNMPNGGTSLFNFHHNVIENFNRSQIHI